MASAGTEKPHRFAGNETDASTFNMSAQKEEQQETTSEDQQANPARKCPWESRVKRILNIIRVIALLAAVGYFFYNHPENYLSKRISQGVAGLREWRHHPYTLPEFYSLCTRDGRGIYTSDPEAEWAQCVTVQNGTIVDVGDFSES
jgi:hypothetical protein